MRVDVGEIGEVRVDPAKVTPVGKTVSSSVSLR
jgi:hypothetical protein